MYDRLGVLEGSGRGGGGGEKIAALLNDHPTESLESRGLRTEGSGFRI